MGIASPWRRVTDADRLRRRRGLEEEEERRREKVSGYVRPCSCYCCSSSYTTEPAPSNP